jgi:resuscitation-promoting factor RpfB
MVVKFSKMSKILHTALDFSKLVPNSLPSAVLIILLFFIFVDFPFQINTEVLGAEKVSDETLYSTQPIHTISRFETKELTEETILKRKTIYKDDPESEIGEEKTLEEGTDGKKTKVIKITYYEGKEYERETVSTDVLSPVDKVIAKGTKLVWRTIDTPDGEIRYWRKMRVWATHYDSHCLGCNEWTAIGMRQGKGVIAVDPKVIKLRSKLYVPGYGQAVAGDVGGAVKGNIIDLGFEDARTAGWSARYVDIYLE